MHLADLIAFVVIHWQALICQMEQQMTLLGGRSEVHETEDMQNLGLEHRGDSNGRREICEMVGGKASGTHLRWWSRMTSGSERMTVGVVVLSVSGDDL